MDNNLEIPLKLSKILEDSGIIKKFIVDKKDNYVKLRLNSKFDPPINIDVSLEIIGEKNGWIKFTDKFRKDIKDFGVDNEHNLWIYSALNENGDLIRGIIHNIDSDLNGQTKNNYNNVNNTNITKCYKENEEQNQKEGRIIDDDDLEIISPSQALRKDIGRYKVKGTIISISEPFKMILGVRFYCGSCRQFQEFLFSISMFQIPNFYFPTCKNCKHLGKSSMPKPIFVNSINIKIQNSEEFDDLERLPVFLFNENTEAIGVGERVIIKGIINILNIKKRHFTYFYGESIQYLNREDLTLTESDIKIIKRFREIHKDHVIDKLVEMFDPSIVENDPVKKGVLMSAANTSEKIGNDSEHIDILFIGPPGTGKTKMLRRATELVPGSSNAGGQYSTGKSLTAIIEKSDNGTTLILGLIPRSRGAFCAINELGRQAPEDQDKLYDVMQERQFPFDKHGIHADIPAPTTILASANPVNNDRWIDDDKIDFNQFPFLEPLKDRYDLIFPFHYKKTKKENDEFIDKLSQIEAKKAKKQLPDYTQFLVKYIQYTKQFNPVLTDEARIMLAEFSKRILNKGFGSPRVVITLPKLAKAIARLKLKNVADEEEAKEVMEFYNAILVKFQKNVIVSQSPKFLAYEKGVKVVEIFKEFGGISLEEIFEIMCKEDKQLANYFGYGERSLKIRDNIKTRNVSELLINNSNIIKIGEKPIVLKWLCDVCDPCDPIKSSKNIQNEEKNNVKPTENDLEPRSHGSHTSHSQEKKEEEVEQSSEEKWRREQEEISKKWNKGLE